MCAAVLLTASAGVALAKTDVRVTAAGHENHGRVVLNAPNETATVTQSGDLVRVRFAGETAFTALPPLPRNVLAMKLVPGGMDLTVAAGAVMRDMRIGARVVVDVADPFRAPRAQTRDAKPASLAAPLAAPLAPPLAAREVAPGPAPPPIAARTPQAAPADPAPVKTADKQRTLTVSPDAPPNAFSATASSKDPPASPKEKVATAAPKDPIAASKIQSPIVIAPAGPASAKTATPTPADPIVTATPPANVQAAPAAAKAPASVKITPPQSPAPSSPIPIVAAEAQNAPLQAADPTPAAPATIPATATPDPIVTPPASLEATQVWPITRDAPLSGPVALIANKTRIPAGLTGGAIQLPFADPIGAALFTRGDTAFVVFDERRPIDLAALKDDPIFGTAVVTIYPAATVVRVKLPDGHAAMLSRDRAEWRVAVVTATPRPAALVPIASDGAVSFTAEQPGQVVAIADPATGGTLLVGTQRKPGQAVAMERRTAEYILPITQQGIVVDPLSDTIGLRITKTGFVLTGPANGLALSPAQPMAEAIAEAARLTRQFEFPGQTTEALVWRAKQQAIAAAVAPALARGPKRIALAQTMVSLGLGVEAQSLIKLAVKDDPKLAASPDSKGLGAIAALMAGRGLEAGDLTDPGLNGSDEIALWRALQAAAADEDSPKAAGILAATAPLLFTYPAEIQRRFLPLALETMILGGAVAPAERLLAQREKDPDLGYARALLKQAKGDTDGALKLLDELTRSRSQLDHARAVTRAIELRLATGTLDPKAAADALEKSLYGWRGDWRDLAVRRRIADLRRQHGAWREAFAILRGAKADFPAQTGEIERQMKDAFAALPTAPSIDRLTPTDLILLLEENATLLADGPEGEPMRARLAEKLMALDLPKPADSVLSKLMRAAPIGMARAGFGATLATLRLNENDNDGALVALSESNAAEMPDAVRERRAMITARVQAKRGQAGAAMEALAPLNSREADESRAAILERAKDWPAARDALALLAARVVPPTGLLDEAQRKVMLRFATAAAHAGDEIGLAAMREKMDGRLGSGPQADMFRLLTAAPVRGTADLPRARAEMGLARALAANTPPGKPLVK